MDQKTDAEIVARVLKGDRSSYALLVDAYKGPVFNLALRLTGSREDAEDLTQEIFIRAYQKLYTFDQGKKYFSWLYTLSINLIRNHMKKKAPEISEDRLSYAIHLNSGKEQEKLIAEEKSIQLENALLRLPADVREAIILKYLQEVTFEEVAEITGDSVSAVKMRIYRGLSSLKEMMAKEKPL